MLNISFINDLAMKAVDGFYKAWPQKTPSNERLRQARIVAHRGFHEPKNIKENTLKAFELAQKNKLWGIEFDVRWTKDDVPVVLHDVDLARVFPGVRQRLSDLSFSELHSIAPEVPRLKDVLHGFGRDLHFMIELKEALNTQAKREHFAQLLSHLEPGKDFHILSLKPEFFKDLDFLPKASFLPVAEWNVAELSECALNNSWGGLTGHYLLLNEKIRLRHKQQGQKIGSGFANSKNLLFRELNRDAEWIFTDTALTLKNILDKALKS